MQYGSVYGHGAYLGPDFTADYLHRSAQEVRRAHGDTPDAAERVRQELRQNRYDPASDVLTWTDAQAAAFNVLRQHYEAEILNRSASGGGGLGPGGEAGSAWVATGLFVGAVLIIQKSR